MVTILRSILLFTTLAYFTGCADITEQRRIASAAAGYLQLEGQTAPFRIKVEAVDHNYARAVATPLDGKTDPATIFLTRVGGNWKGILMGTGFDPGVYRELNIPPKVQVH